MDNPDAVHTGAAHLRVEHPRPGTLLGVDDLGLRTTAALLAAGVPRTTISYRCRTGRWTRLLPGVIALGEVSPETLVGAVLLGKPEAVLSHRTAAWWWGWCDVPEVVEATVPRTASVRGPEWLRLHRTGLDPGSLVVHGGARVVVRERALLDCGMVLAPDDADRLVDRAVQDGVGLRGLAQQCLVDGGRWGVVSARRQLREAAVNVRSEPERLVARALARRGWRVPANVSVQGWLCDFVDEPSRTVIEVDGREFHSAGDVFIEDRRRQNALLRTRHVQRYAAAEVFADPEAVAEEILSVLRRRRAARR